MPPDPISADEVLAPIAADLRTRAASALEQAAEQDRQAADHLALAQAAKAAAVKARRIAGFMSAAADKAAPVTPPPGP